MDNLTMGPDGTGDLAAILQDFMDGAVGRSLGLMDGDLDVLLPVANAKLRSGDMVEAQRLYVALVLCQPGRFEYQQGFANFSLQVGNYDVAFRIGVAMITLQPEHPLGHYFAGAACFATLRYSDARLHVEVALPLAVHRNDTVLQRDCRRLLQKLDIAQTEWA